MIQSLRNSAGNQVNYIYLDLFDKMTSTTFDPLVLFESQLTKKKQYFVSGFVDLTNKERYIKLTYYQSNDGTDLPLSGILNMGDSDFPYGFYNVTIWQNNSNSNLDPDNAIKIIYKGLMNFAETGLPAVTYTEYTTNDTDTESVYITNTV